MSPVNDWKPDQLKRGRIQAAIWNVLERRGRGRKNVITRDELMAHVRTFVINVTDRELRDAYANMAIVTCDEGLFIPKAPEDIAAFKVYLTNKARPLFERYKRVLLSYPDIAHQGDAQQLDLFGRMEG